MIVFLIDPYKSNSINNFLELHNQELLSCSEIKLVHSKQSSYSAGQKSKPQDQDG